MSISAYAEEEVEYIFLFDFASMGSLFHVPLPQTDAN